MNNEKTVLSEREKILGRIREALKVKAPLPGSHGGLPVQASADPPTSHAREWLPSVGSSVEEQFALFAKNAADLKADFQLLAGRDELKAALVKLRDVEKWQRVASHGGELSDFACKAIGLPVTLTDRGYDVQEMEKCDAGITECDALIAQTGGVVVTSRSAGGRALSILPPHHVVLARHGQLVADLPAAFEFLQKKYAPDFPSMISFITGPSRTGDIERILVLGAHGPKKLTIFCF
jgi:L-lactate dehydrogenase complex protein LldG